jgi:hypothetical protein
MLHQWLHQYKPAMALRDDMHLETAGQGIAGMSNLSFTAHVKLID